MPVQANKQTIKQQTNDDDVCDDHNNYDDYDDYGDYDDYDAHDDYDMQLLVGDGDNDHA